MPENTYIHSLKKLVNNEKSEIPIAEAIGISLFITFIHRVSALS